MQTVHNTTTKNTQVASSLQADIPWHAAYAGRALKLKRHGRVPPERQHHRLQHGYIDVQAPQTEYLSIGDVSIIIINTSVTADVVVMASELLLE